MCLFKVRIFTYSTGTGSIQDSQIFDTLVCTNSTTTPGKSFVGVLVGKRFLLLVMRLIPYTSHATLKSALEFLQLEIFTLKYFYFFLNN